MLTDTVRSTPQDLVGGSGNLKKVISSGLWGSG